MSDYDFRNLNDKEFETLANDLLSQREGAVVDRFKAGKDGGIDGRFFAINGTEVIIQSKHWIKSGITALIKRLEKDELPKIKKLNPSRYILVTSLELSDANKKKIKAALKPYIVSEHDILGQENLNDLLSENLDIEKKHYKLWLSSSAVLSIIFNNALTGRSEAKRKEIMESAERYVLTDNHSRALEKLDKTNLVIITGEAGIGKTSLADQLAHFYIAHDFELCVIEEDISEAEAIFRQESKQVFYFDDFLGRNFLTALQDHKDSHILNFIERVSRDNSKRFILTSRTTVLNQGKALSDLFEIKKINKKEYEITIQSLSTLDKARILYNHIWFGNLDEKYIEELYLEKRYLKIVRHKNFNPRLISFITDLSRFSDIPSKDYWGYIYSTLQNPKDVWASVFDNQIDDLMRLAVCLVVFNGNGINEKDFRETFSEQAVNDGLANKSNVNNKLNRTIRNAVGAILQRTVFDENDSARIDLFNPSVADFILGRYLNDWTSLEAFFIHLNTVSSIENLENLKKNSMLGDDGYSQILKKLASEKIGPEHLQKNAVYTLKLTRMVIQQEDKPSRDIFGAIADLVKAINTVPVPKSCIEDACFVLDFVSASKKHQKFQEIISKFIVRCLDEFLVHDDFINLDNLARKLEPEFEETVLPVIKSAVAEYWEDQISQNVAHEGVIDGYLDPKEENDALQELFEYLEDKLFNFDFKAEEISRILEFADIQGQIEANQEASMQGEEDYELWRDSGGSSSQNENALVDDLFQRE